MHHTTHRYTPLHTATSTMQQTIDAFNGWLETTTEHIYTLRYPGNESPKLCVDTTSLPVDFISSLAEKTKTQKLLMVLSELEIVFAHGANVVVPASDVVKEYNEYTMHRDEINLESTAGKPKAGKPKAGKPKAVRIVTKVTDFRSAQHLYTSDPKLHIPLRDDYILFDTIHCRDGGVEGALQLPKSTGATTTHLQVGKSRYAVVFDGSKYTLHYKPGSSLRWVYSLMAMFTGDSYEYGAERAVTKSHKEEKQGPKTAKRRRATPRHAEPTPVPVETIPIAEPIVTEPTPIPVETIPIVEPIVTEPTPVPVETIPIVEPPMVAEPTPVPMETVPIVEPPMVAEPKESVPMDVVTTDENFVDSCIDTELGDVIQTHTASRKRKHIDDITESEPRKMPMSLTDRMTTSLDDSDNDSDSDSELGGMIEKLD